eukprot:COSAG05_NODE_80_length_21046_cov_45.708325_2_plen_106_part_00
MDEDEVYAASMAGKIYNTQMMGLCAYLNWFDLYGLESERIHLHLKCMNLSADGGGAPLSELLCADDCRQIEEEGGSRGGVEKKKKNKKKKSKKKKSKKKKSKGEL